MRQQTAVAAYYYLDLPVDEVAVVRTARRAR
jgi:hypothetical protein